MIGVDQGEEMGLGDMGAAEGRRRAPSDESDLVWITIPSVPGSPVYAVYAVDDVR